MKATLVALVLLSSGTAAAAADKPAAVQVCLNLPSGIPLFAEAAKRNYRAHPEGGFVLDFDVALNGKAPQRLTRNGPNCFRAWVTATPLNTIAVDFSRTDLNLKAASKSVNLKLKPDLWYDGGSLDTERAPVSKVTTALPGKLEFARLENAEWSKGAFPIKDLSKLAAGRYTVKYEPPPPPQGSCDITVRVEATGTVRADSRPAVYKELVETYQREFAPEVAKGLKATCNQAQALEIELRIVDGAYRNPWSPKVTKITRREREPKYDLIVDGRREPFVEGQELEVGYGQAIALEEHPAAEVHAAADSEAKAP